MAVVNTPDVDAAYENIREVFVWVGRLHFRHNLEEDILCLESDVVW